jgi:hypothetical protein
MRPESSHRWSGEDSIMSLHRFDPPAYLADLDQIRNGRDQWSEFLERAFQAAIKVQEQAFAAAGEESAIVQFFDPRKYDPNTVVEQPIVWNAFPKNLLTRFGRDRAFVEADGLWPLYPFNAYANPYDSSVPNRYALSNTSVWFRPLDEYCEWFVEREPRTNRIVRVTFTSEPPEYWTALFGGTVSIDDTSTYTFDGDAAYATQLYRHLTGAHVETDDLRCRVAYSGMKIGDYDPSNKWNSTHGIVHLNCPPNSIQAEIRLAADATVLRRQHDGTPIVSPDALICASRYGGAYRNSDPTIGASANALARLGAMVTLVNPVGLYMDDIDTAGWALPEGISPSDCITIARGKPGQVERLVIQLPPDTGRTLSDLTIGGVPLRWGGQIAECITVKLVGGATKVGKISNPALPSIGRGFVQVADSRLLDTVKVAVDLPPGTRAAFSEPHTISPRANAEAHIRAGNSARRL